VAEGGALLRR